MNQSPAHLKRNPANKPDRTENPWSKSIPHSRDHAQSQALVAILAPILIALCLHAASFAMRASSAERILFLESLVLSLLFALAARKLRAATRAAAALGALICLLLTFFTGQPRPTFAQTNPLHSALTPLLELFILTFAATRAGRRQKQRAGLAEPRRGRSASQILANLAAAALSVSLLSALLIQALGHLTHRFLFLPAILPAMALAALAEATADTVSSEFGQAFGGPPILLTTLRRVPSGTDGAITLLGTFAGTLTAFLVAAVGAWALHLTHRNALIAFLAGTAGLFFDSLLGATIERRGWLGNDLVNLTSTVFSALAALFALLLLAPQSVPLS